MPDIPHVKRRVLLPVIMGSLLCAVWTCNLGSGYPGFSRTRSGIYYRLNVIGENSVSPLPGDFITADITYSTLDDSIFFKGRRKFILEKPSYSGSVEECLAMMNVGDEADFILNASDFFNFTLGVNPPGFFNEDENILISVRLLDVQSESEYYKEREAFTTWIDSFEEYEKIRLQQFIRESRLSAEPDSAGLYLISLDSGTGRRTIPGDTVEVHYEGRFLYGKLFDSTRKRNETVKFVYGREWPLIEGLDRAVGRMSEGERAMVIVPSDLAFGRSGSSTGIIPPYSSLIFEIEIVSLQ